MVIADMSLLIEHTYVSITIHFSSNNLNSRMKPTFVENTDVTMHDWIGGYKWKEDSHSTISRIHPVIGVVQKLDHLKDFGYILTGLRKMGPLERVLCNIEGNGRDNLLVKKIKDLRRDRAAMLHLENLWNDETLTEIQEARRIGIEQAQMLIRRDLEEMTTGSEVWIESKEEKLRLFNFICMRELRDSNCQQRAEWEGLYREVEITKRLPHVKYQRFREEEPWLKWLEKKYGILPGYGVATVPTSSPLLISTDTESVVVER
jgi:hypothetical protein